MKVCFRRLIQRVILKGMEYGRACCYNKLVLWIRFMKWTKQIHKARVIRLLHNLRSSFRSDKQLLACFKRDCKYRIPINIPGNLKNSSKNCWLNNHVPRVDWTFYISTISHHVLQPCNKNIVIFLESGPTDFIKNIVF